MTVAISACRTAVPGSHVERRDDCDLTRVAYNSALWADPVMGSWCVGIGIFRQIVVLLLSITARSCVSIGSATDGRSQTGTNTLEAYFSASKMLHVGQAEPLLTVSRQRSSVTNGREVVRFWPSIKLRSSILLPNR